MNISKNTVLISIGSLAAILFVFSLLIFNYKRDSIISQNINDSGEYYFTKNDTYPKINVELNKEFEIKLGQIASFKEGFQVMFIGFQTGCGGASPSGLEDLILRKAEASQCPQGISFPVYAVIKDGKVYEGSDIYNNGFNISTNSSNTPNSIIIKVELLPEDLTRKLQEEQANRFLEQQGTRKNDINACLKITNNDQKNNCVSFIARELFYSMVPYGTKTTPDPAIVVSAVRDVCSKVGFISGMCKIIGEKTPMTQQQCKDISNPKSDEWPGASFIEDCFIVSAFIYSESN